LCGGQFRTPKALSESEHPSFARKAGHTNCLKSPQHGKLWAQGGFWLWLKVLGGVAGWMWGQGSGLAAGISWKCSLHIWRVGGAIICDLEVFPCVWFWSPWSGLHTCLLLTPSHWTLHKHPQICLTSLWLSVNGREGPSPKPPRKHVKGPALCGWPWRVLTNPDRTGSDLFDHKMSLSSHTQDSHFSAPKNQNHFHN
jgi:hypothetical protein